MTDSVGLKCSKLAKDQYQNLIRMNHSLKLSMQELTVLKHFKEKVFTHHHQALLIYLDLNVLADLFSIQSMLVHLKKNFQRNSILHCSQVVDMLSMQRCVPITSFKCLKALYLNR